VKPRAHGVPTGDDERQFMEQSTDDIR
jgi:hypothetical protein